MAEADAEQAERLYSSIGGLCDLRADLMRPKLSDEELERFDSEENARLAAEVKRLTWESERAAVVCEEAYGAIELLQARVRELEHARECTVCAPGEANCRGAVSHV